MDEEQLLAAISKLSDPEIDAMLADPAKMEAFKSQMPKKGLIQSLLGGTGGKSGMSMNLMADGKAKQSQLASNLGY